MTAAKPKSDMMVIREYFGAKLPEMKDFIHATDKEQVKAMAEGIRSGTLTY